MRKYSLVTLAVLLFSLQAVAQETPKAELFGGYSFAGFNFNGWAASITGNVNRWFGLTADFSGHYGGSVDEDGFNERERVHSYHFGPRFAARFKRVTLFAHVLFGGSSLKDRLTLLNQRLVFSDTSFSMAAGCGLDVKLNDRVAVRAFQIDYLRTRFFNEGDGRGRLSFGLVFRFGKK